LRHRRFCDLIDDYRRSAKSWFAVSESPYSDDLRPQDERAAVRTSANEHDLKDVISAYAAAGAPGRIVLSRGQVLSGIAAVAVSLAVAGLFVGLSGPGPQKTAAAAPVETPVSTATAKAMPPECAGQTWPYVSRECLAARGESSAPAAPAAATKSN
jgi:hypothetical protein